MPDSTAPPVPVKFGAQARDIQTDSGTEITRTVQPAADAEAVNNIAVNCEGATHALDTTYTAFSLHTARPLLIARTGLVPRLLVTTAACTSLARLAQRHPAHPAAPAGQGHTVRPRRSTVAADPSARPSPTTTPPTGIPTGHSARSS
jgi:hypothetical protein